MASLLKYLGMRVICNTKGQETKSSQLRVGKKLYNFSTDCALRYVIFNLHET